MDDARSFRLLIPWCPRAYFSNSLFVMVFSVDFYNSVSAGYAGVVGALEVETAAGGYRGELVIGERAAKPAARCLTGAVECVVRVRHLI